MHKIFFNDKAICFTDNIESSTKYTHYFTLTFFSEEIVPFMLELLLRDDKLNIVITVKEYELAFKAFKKQFKLIKAAGGIVKNNNNQKLFIYRLDKWDLPKGKIEKGEEIEVAAIREIEEECGISDLTITGQLVDTYHVYSLKEELILKQTYWFELESSFDGELIPQLEEDITKVEWLTDSEINDKVINNTYASIKELL